MNAGCARADRFQSVREAARAWQRAGWIDESIKAAIDGVYPDDRVRTGPVFRILFFIFTLLALEAVVCFFLFFFFSRMPESSVAAFLLCAGVAAAAATEYLMGPVRRRQSGIESAFSFFSLIQLSAGTALFVFQSLKEAPATSLLLLMVAVYCGAAAWHWGYWAYAAASAVLLFAFCARMPYGRLLWVALPTLVFPLMQRFSKTAKLPPSLRRSCTALWIVTILAFYAAVNLYSLDHRLIESIAARVTFTGRPPLVSRLWGIVLMAAVPLFLIISGMRRRMRLLLDIGILLGVLSLVTIPAYIAVAPLWLILAVSGISAIAAGFWIRRFLESGGIGDRGGFTARTLLDVPESRTVLEMVANVAVLTPEARTVSEKPGFHGDGGEFGGGGASGTF